MRSKNLVPSYCCCWRWGAPAISDGSCASSWAVPFPSELLIWALWPRRITQQVESQSFIPEFQRSLGSPVLQHSSLAGSDITAAQPPAAPRWRNRTGISGSTGRFVNPLGLWNHLFNVKKTLRTWGFYWLVQWCLALNAFRNVLIGFGLKNNYQCEKIVNIAKRGKEELSNIQNSSCRSRIYRLTVTHQQ